MSRLLKTPRFERMRSLGKCSVAALPWRGLAVVMGRTGFCRQAGAATRFGSRVRLLAVMAREKTALTRARPRWPGLAYSGHLLGPAKHLRNALAGDIARVQRERLGRHRGAAGTCIKRPEAQRHDLQRFVHNRADQPKRMRLWHPRLQAHIAEQCLTRAAVIASHHSAPHREPIANHTKTRREMAFEQPVSLFLLQCPKHLAKPQGLKLLWVLPPAGQCAIAFSSPWLSLCRQHGPDQSRLFHGLPNGGP